MAFKRGYLIVATEIEHRRIGQVLRALRGHDAPIQLAGLDICVQMFRFEQVEQGSHDGHISVWSHWHSGRLITISGLSTTHPMRDPLRDAIYRAPVGEYRLFFLDGKLIALSDRTGLRHIERFIRSWNALQ